ncbi:ribbon-helix-helix domain-containing protein [Ferrimonas lipolytica]
MVTSIRLERFFWGVLEEIAVRDDMTATQLITKLYLESLDAEHDMGNFTSFLRVCCSRYLSLAADGVLNRDGIEPIATLDAQQLLDQEQQQLNQRQLKPVSIHRDLQ